MMRTTINIPNHLFHEVMHLTHAKSQTKAVNFVLSDWVRLKKIEEIKKLRGRLDVIDNIKSLRALELKEIEDSHE